MSVFNNLFKSNRHQDKIGVVGLNNELNAIYINSIIDENVVVVCSSLFEASSLFQSLTNYREDVLFFPMDEFLSSEAIELNLEFKTTRIETLNSILDSKQKHIVVTNLMGYLRFLPPVSDWKNSIIGVKKNSVIEYNDLIRGLYNIGYERVTTVTATGEIGVRGFIVDVFPIGSDNPVRIEFFDNVIESIRFFDIDTQTSIAEIFELDIYPFSEFVVNKEVEHPREQKYISKYCQPVNIKAYFDNPLVIYKDFGLLQATNAKIHNDIFEYSLEKKQDGLEYMFDFNNLTNRREIFLMSLDNVLKDKKLDGSFQYSVLDAPKYYGDFKKLNVDLKNYIDAKKTVILCLRNKKEISNLAEYIDSKNCVITNEAQIIDNKINIIEKEMAQGFLFENYVFLSNYELFDFKERKINYRNDYRYGSKIGGVDKLELGDYVVHAIHGIGVYNGIKVLNKNDIKKDYLEVLYRGADKLYIPVERINLLSKYSSKEGVQPKINKLGSAEWTRTKLSVKQRIGDIAERLLKIYAQREAELGFAFGPDTEEQIMFENEFIYELTKDQFLATKIIKEDMEKSKPMDRLLCGDVGFGKTEVAFRAMFKAVSYSKQVMYLCPTTILSNQQYENAKERFKNYPINIGLLNRFVSLAKAKKTVEDFKAGKLDILFGTHRLLSKDVEPNDLGLLVIDEEQRFGVTHKEKIKEYKHNVDVLTLSATPIPRTLQMSMVGLRNLSLIETPPVNRYPISTYVTPFNKQVIKEAIYSELSRGGQVFILYNKISDITRKVEEIQKLVPEAKITYAHGGMNKKELEDKMMQFIVHEYDVLVCTTIIETGIDIPNVNTLVIIDANNFGLAQLYQIRGRVGRTNKIAFAYLMYDEHKVLTETAIKRLQTIKDFTHLGSGFKIAAKDLAIRGAGDILGSEQAGFIDTIGIELYIKMLNEEIDKIKGLEIEEEITEEKPLLEVETHIESKYVEDEDLKIEIHRIINEINSYQLLVEKKAIIEDRFGHVTESMNIYMHECWFEKMAKSLKISNVIQTKNNVEIILPRELSDKINGQKLFLESYEISDKFRFAYKNGQIRIKLETYRLEKHFVHYLIRLLELIKNIV